MKKTVLIFIFSGLVASVGMFAQNVTLETQQDVDDFSMTTEVNGNLIIADNEMNPIMDLNGLSSLVKVTGNLRILYNTGLTDISGLSALEEVTGSVSIEGQLLSDISGFSALTTLGQLSIDGNNALTDISGFSALTTVGRGLSIIRNDLLTDISGFPQLTTVEALRITDNRMLSECCIFLPFLDGNNVTIANNATGCESSDAILDGDPCPTIPTMSQWALMILGLILTSLAVVRIRKVAVA